MANVEILTRELLDDPERDLGASAWRGIDQERIDRFADATDDHQWIHVDPARAASGPFGTTIAHGYLTLSLVPAFLGDLLRLTDQERAINYGIDRVRFLAPVPVGSTIRMRGRLAGSEDREDGGIQFSVAFEIEIRGHTRPAAVGEIVLVRYPRP